MTSLLSKQIQNLEVRCSDNEQYSRRECLEVSGISTSRKHDELEDKVRLRLSKIDVNVTTENIEACHQIGKNGTTIVKFSKQEKA